MLWKSWNVFVKDLEMLPSVQELGLSYISFLNTFMSSTWFGLTLSVLVSHVIVQFSKASSSVLKLEESQNLKQLTVMTVCNGVSTFSQKTQKCAQESWDNLNSSGLTLPVFWNCLGNYLRNLTVTRVLLFFPCTLCCIVFTGKRSLDFCFY